ncbi:KE2 family protein [Ascosphaera apis ARSEF 7405]|uniref:KE2 family protein n=1 Tax=Ascosphaera apis ARSEF 7405 TaxID=392613 RepID=A0A166PMA7_9EURO|nr:KE2 family protein [Ascosphaera apis ARSEF 7405]
MSVPNEALAKLVQEIEAQAIKSQQDIAIVKASIAAKQRELRLSQLTSKELSDLPATTNVYEGVGKMFVVRPMNTINSRISQESLQLQTEITNLEKKLHYLETTFKNSRDNIQRIMTGGRT